MVAIVVVVALVAGAVGFVTLRDGGDDEAAAEPRSSRPTTTSEAPTSTTEAPTTTTTTGSGDDEFTAIVEDLEAYVEEERGLEFLRDVEVELADDEEFEARLLEDFDEGLEDLEDTGAILGALGFLEPGEDVVEALRGLLGAGVIGFYDPETEVLVVRGTEATPYVQQTIVHELVHALEDQHFELYRPDIDDADDESSTGFSALVEGSAVVVQDAWTDTLSSSELEELAEEEFRAGSGIDPFSFPPVLIELLVAPYEYGPDLVDAILDDGGQEALDLAFADPPTTSREMLVPSAYLDGFTPIEVAAPPADGEVFDQGAVGQLVLQLLLAEELSPSEAELVADGWAGDWYVAWDAGDGETCLRADFAAEDAGAADDLAEGLEVWADGASDASVERTTDGLVRLTACG